jgi:hypothetical protein
MVAGPALHHGRDLGDGRALGGAHIIAAGGHAGQEAHLVIQAEQPAQAKAGIEMIARPRRDERLGRERPLHHGHFALADGQRVRNRVDDQRARLETFRQLQTEFHQSLRRRRRGFKPEDFADFVRFLFVQAQDHVEVLFKSPDQIQRAQNVLARAFLRVGQVKEKDAPRPFHRRANLLEDRFPEIAHVREHRPVDKAHQVRAAELFRRSGRARSGPGCFPR